MTRSFTISQPPRNQNDLRQLLVRQDLRLEEMPFTFTGKLPPYGNPVEFTSDAEVVDFFSKSHGTVTFDVVIEQTGVSDVRQQLKLLDDDFVTLQIFPFHVGEESGAVQEEFFIPEKNVGVSMARAVKRAILSKTKMKNAVVGGSAGGISPALSGGVHLEVSLILKNNKPKPLENNDEEVKEILRKHAEMQMPVRVSYRWKQLAKSEAKSCRSPPWSGIATGTDHQSDKDKCGGIEAAWGGLRSPLSKRDSTSQLEVVGTESAGSCRTLASPPSFKGEDGPSRKPPLPLENANESQEESRAVNVKSSTEEKERNILTSSQAAKTSLSSKRTSNFSPFSAFQEGSPRPPSLPFPPLFSGPTELTRGFPHPSEVPRRQSLASFSSTEVSLSKRVSCSSRAGSVVEGGGGGRGSEKEMGNSVKERHCSHLDSQDGKKGAVEPTSPAADAPPSTSPIKIQNEEETTAVVPSPSPISLPVASSQRSNNSPLPLPIHPVSENHGGSAINGATSSSNVQGGKPPPTDSNDKGNATARSTSPIATITPTATPPVITRATTARLSSAPSPAPPELKGASEVRHTPSFRSFTSDSSLNPLPITVPPIPTSLGGPPTRMEGSEATTKRVEEPPVVPAPSEALSLQPLTSTICASSSSPQSPTSSPASIGVNDCHSPSPMTNISHDDTQVKEGVEESTACSLNALPAREDQGDEDTSKVGNKKGCWSSLSGQSSHTPLSPQSAEKPRILVGGTSQRMSDSSPLVSASLSMRQRQDSSPASPSSGNSPDFNSPHVPDSASASPNTNHFTTPISPFITKSVGTPKGSRTTGFQKAVLPPPPPPLPSSLCSNFSRNSPRSPIVKSHSSASCFPPSHVSSMNEFSDLQAGHPLTGSSPFPAPPSQPQPPFSSRVSSSTTVSTSSRTSVSQSAPNPLLGRKVLISPSISRASSPPPPPLPPPIGSGGKSSTHNSFGSRTVGSNRSRSSGPYSSDVHRQLTSANSGGTGSASKRGGSLHESLKDVPTTCMTTCGGAQNDGLTVGMNHPDELGNRNAASSSMRTSMPKMNMQARGDDVLPSDVETGESSTTSHHEEKELPEERKQRSKNEGRSKEQGESSLDHQKGESVHHLPREVPSDISSPTNQLVTVSVLLFLDDSKGHSTPRSTPTATNMTTAHPIFGTSPPGKKISSTSSSRLNGVSSSNSSNNNNNSSMPRGAPTSNNNSNRGNTLKSHSLHSSNENSDSCTFSERFGSVSRDFKFLKNTQNVLYLFKKWCSLEKDLFKITPFPEEITIEVAVGTTLHPVKHDNDWLEWAALSREAQQPLRIRLTLPRDQLHSINSTVSSSSSSSSNRLRSSQEQKNSSFCYSLHSGFPGSTSRFTKTGSPIGTATTPKPGVGISPPLVMDTIQEEGEKGRVEEVALHTGGSGTAVSTITTTTATTTITISKGGDANSPTMLTPPAPASMMIPVRKSVTLTPPNGKNTSSTVFTSSTITGGISSSLPTNSSPLNGSPHTTTTTTTTLSGNLGTLLPPLKSASPLFTPEGSPHGGGGVPLSFHPNPISSSRSPASTSSLPSGRTTSPRSTVAAVQGTYPLHQQTVVSPSQVYSPISPVHSLTPRGPLPPQGSDSVNGNATVPTSCIIGTGAGAAGSNEANALKDVVEGKTECMASPSCSESPPAEKRLRSSHQARDGFSFPASQTEKKPSHQGNSSGGEGLASLKLLRSSNASLPGSSSFQLISLDKSDSQKKNSSKREHPFEAPYSFALLRRPSPLVVCSAPSTSETLIQCFVKWDNRESLILCRLHKDFMLSDLKRAICFEFSAPPKTDSSTLWLKYKKIKEDTKKRQLTVETGIVDSDDHLRGLITDTNISNISWEVCTRGSAFGASSAMGGGAMQDREISLMAAEVIAQLGSSFRYAMLEELFSPAKIYFQNPSQQNFFRALETLPRDTNADLEPQSWTVKEVENLLCRCFSDVQKDKEVTEVCCTCLAVITFCKSRKQALDRFLKSVYRNMRKTKGAVSVALLNEIMQHHRALLPPSLRSSGSTKSTDGHFKSPVAEDRKAITEHEFLDVCLSIFETLPGNHRGDGSPSFASFIAGDDKTLATPLAGGSSTENEGTETAASQLLNDFCVATMEGIIRRSNFLDFPAPFHTESNFLFSSTSVSATPFSGPPSSSTFRLSTPGASTFFNSRDGKGSFNHGENHTGPHSSSTATWASIYSDQMRAVLSDRCSTSEFEHFCWSAVQPGADSRLLVIVSIIGALLAPSKDCLSSPSDNTTTTTDAHHVLRPGSKQFNSESSSHAVSSTSTTTSTVDYSPHYYVDYVLGRCKGKVVEVLYTRMLSFGNYFQEETKELLLSPIVTSPPTFASLPSSSVGNGNTGTAVGPLTSSGGGSLGKTTNSIRETPPRTPSPTAATTLTNAWGIPGSPNLPLRTLHHIVWVLLSPSLDPALLGSDISPVAAALVEWAFAAVQLVCVLQKQVFPVMPPYHSQYIFLPLHPIVYELQKRSM